MRVAQHFSEAGKDIVHALATEPLGEQARFQDFDQMHPHIAEAAPVMRGFPPAQRMSIAHHVDVAQAVALVLEAPSPAHRIYNVVDDEAPDLANFA